MYKSHSSYYFYKNSPLISNYLLLESIDVIFQYYYLEFEIKKLQLQIIRIFEFIFTTLFFRKRMLTKATINALYNLETHDTNKIKTAFDFEFLDMKVYLKELVGKMK
jgi:hypothetical protein